MIVEFVGVPATGKTTMAKALANILASTSIKVDTWFGGRRRGESRWKHRSTRLYHSLRLCATDPFFAARSAKAIVHTGQPDFRGWLSVTINWLFKVSLIRRARSNSSVSLFDEGIVHAAWSINYAAARAFLPMTLIRQAYGDHGLRSLMIVEVDSTPEIRLSRLKERSGDRIAQALRRGCPAELLERRAGDALAPILEAIKSLPKEGMRPSFLSVDNGGGSNWSGDLMEVASEIRTLMAASMKRSGS